MLAEAEPKPTTSNADETTQQKEEDPNVPVRIDVLFLYKAINISVL